MTMRADLCVLNRISLSRVRSPVPRRKNTQPGGHRSSLTLLLCVGTKLEVKTKTPNGVQFTVKGNQDPKVGESPATMPLSAN